MTSEEYVTTQKQLTILGVLVAQLELDAFLEQITICETTAPMVDPTLWIRGHRKLEQVKRLARAAKALRDEVLRQHAAELAANTGGSP